MYQRHYSLMLGSKPRSITEAYHFKATLIIVRLKYRGPYRVYAVFIRDGAPKLLRDLYSALTNL